MKKVIPILVIVVVLIAACLAVFFLYPRPKGYIKIDTPGVRLNLSGGRFGETKVTSAANGIAVTVGEYRPQYLEIEMQKGSDTWLMESTGPWGQLDQIKVEKDKTTILKLGPPLAIKPAINKTESRVSVALAIFGQAGEQYRNVITKNSQPAPTPNVKIVDEAGTVLASGKFEYG